MVVSKSQIGNIFARVVARGFIILKPTKKNGELIDI